MRIRAGQGGFTLVEMMAVMALVGLTATGVSALFLQETRGTTESKSVVSTSMDIGDAGRWFGRDASMAQSSDLVDGAPPVDQIALTWTDWSQLEGTMHQSRYWLSGTELKRDYDGTVTTAARNISSVNFSQAGRVITASVR